MSTTTTKCYHCGIEIPQGALCAECWAKLNEDTPAVAPPHLADALVEIRVSLLKQISDELDRAYAKHGRGQWGRHEFYAILKEEVDELWDAIKADHPQGQVVLEAIQIAAMVFRYLETGDRYLHPNDKVSHGL